MSNRTTGWSELRLGDVCRLRAGSGFKSEMQGRSSGDYPFIKQSDMSLPQNGRFIVEATNWVDEGDLKTLKAKPHPAGTVVFGKIGEGLKRNRFRVLTRPTIIDNNMMGATPTRDVASDFFAYLIGQVDMGALSEGSALPYLRTEDLARVPILVPPISEQRAIAGVLGALDDKIESNRRQMSTLGSMVQLVFLSQASEANREALLSIATVQKGVSYRSIDLQESKTAMMTLKSIDRNGGYKADGLKPYVGAYKATQVIRPGEFVVAQTDLTQGAEVVGRVVLVPRQSKFETLIASLDLAIVRPIDPADHWYLYAALVQEDFREHCRSRTSGTTVLHLGADALSSYRVPWSDSRARMRVASEVESLVRLAESRGQEIDHLMALRDTLLPELLSGRVQVRDAEKFVEGAV